MFAAAILLTSAVLLIPTNLPPTAQDVTINVSAQNELQRRAMETLRKGCFDCHSRYTRWPWYARIGPVGWLLARDVTSARNALDLTNWPTDHRLTETTKEKAIAICAVLKANRMPPRRYLLLHRESAVNTEEKRTVCEWAGSEGRGHRP
jgi:hypothetical protein